MKSFKEIALNEHVHVEKLYDAINSNKSEEFITAIYDWFEEFYPSAPLYAGDDTPEDYIEYLELKDKKKLRDFFLYASKKNLI